MAHDTVSIGTPPLRVAVCVAGQARTLETCYPSIAKNLLNQLDHPIVFAHIGDGEGADALHLLKPAASSVGDPPIDEEKFPAARRMLEAALRKYQGAHATNTWLNILKQFQSWFIAHSLKEQYERDQGWTFDWVIRLRPDTIVESSIEDLRSLDPQFLYVPAHDSWGGVNDRFGFGGPAVMKQYCSLFQHIEELAQSWEDVRHINAERILKLHLQRCGTPMAQTRVTVSLVRTSGKIVGPMFTGRGDSFSWRGLKNRLFRIAGKYLRLGLRAVGINIRKY